MRGNHATVVRDSCPLPPNITLFSKHLEQAQLSISRGVTEEKEGRKEGEDHQLVRICLKKQRRGRQKKGGEGTKRSLELRRGEGGHGRGRGEKTLFAALERKFRRKKGNDGVCHG